MKYLDLIRAVTAEAAEMPGPSPGIATLNAPSSPVIGQLSLPESTPSVPRSITRGDAHERNERYEGTGTPGRGRLTADPRPDLQADSPLWGALLALAYDLDGPDPTGLFGALHGLRCCGARLVNRGGTVSVAAGELGDEDYLALRHEYVSPHVEALNTLLQQVVTAQTQDLVTREA